ncbi:hypothetical protein [Pelagibius marinus]|uniref:hypothetical protein n=1 Tax=Pelagibius marinus TaxID=2762760 RepID=UPI0018725D7E|nr:hypothetical protein [Pelagibius marinus]
MDDKGIEGRDSTDAQESETPDSGAQDAAEAQDVKSAVKQVAETSLPLEVGSVVLGEDGHIRPVSEDRPLHFRFSACGIEFEADLASKTAPLRLRANLGKLPFSAESPDGRRLARTVMAATDRLRRGHILLSEEQDMVLEGELNPPSPRTPVAVIATAVALIIDFKPYLDLLGEAVSLRRPPPPDEEAGTPVEA